VRSKLLIVSHDVVGERMAGPGIRYWEMARAMSNRLGVTLLAPGNAPTGEGFDTGAYVWGQWASLAPAVSQADVLLFSGDLLVIFPELAACGKPLVLDIYDPHTFETLHLHAALPQQNRWSLTWIEWTFCVARHWQVIFLSAPAIASAIIGWASWTLMAERMPTTTLQIPRCVSSLMLFRLDYHRNRHAAAVQP